MDFTCNKCQHRTSKAVNPHAYANGTVFVQCEGCLVHHKLVDNLGLFNQMKGPVYSENVRPVDAAKEAAKWDGVMSILPPPPPRPDAVRGDDNGGDGN